jgi:hypothetical protein
MANTATSVLACLGAHCALRNLASGLSSEITDDKELILDEMHFQLTISIMDPTEYNTSFSGAYNYGVQAGYIAGNVETHHYHPVGKLPFPLSIELC